MARIIDLTFIAALWGCLTLAACGETNQRQVDAEVGDARPEVGDAQPEVGGTLDAGVSDPLAPGPELSDLAAAGTGVCAGKTLADVIASARPGHPELNGVTILHGQDNVGFGDGGSLIFAFARSDGGFALAFRAESGGCMDVCSRHEYWYFTTDDNCTPRLVGHFRSDDAADMMCELVDGTPMWDTPPPVDVIAVCGTDLRPQNLNGVYQIHAKGRSDGGCSQTKGGGELTIDTVLTLTVAQDPSDLSKGTVTFQGTGEAHIDGQALPATFLRRRFTLRDDQHQSSGMCFDQWMTNISFDFEGMGTSQLVFFESKSLEGCASSSAYCKTTRTLALSQN